MGHQITAEEWKLNKTITPTAQARAAARPDSCTATTTCTRAGCRIPTPDLLQARLFIDQPISAGRQSIPARKPEADQHGWAASGLAGGQASSAARLPATRAANHRAVTCWARG